jgi:rhomboid protease GluP
MEYEVIIFWLVCLSCLSGLVVVATHVRSAGWGWLVLYLVILGVAVCGWWWHQNALVYAALALWGLLVVGPGLLSRLYLRRFLQQRYGAAGRVARLISWLHPADGWRQQPQIVRALELAQRGDFAAATETLQRFQGTHSLVGLAALTHLYRLTNQWEELLRWQQQHATEFQRHPQLLGVLLRAYGETGDLRAMVELYGRHQQRIARLVPASSRDLCRLALFAFCGQRELVEHLFDGSLALVPAPTREFWLATADWAAGNWEPARRRWEALLPAADPPTRQAIERRLARIAVRPEPLDAAGQRVVEEAAREHGHEESFGAQPSLFSKQARATQLLILLNVLMFVVESVSGGNTDADNLYRLGALAAPAVRAGEWWRLIASLFLHWGPLHLAMNMLALWWLGPFVEFALGFRRFLQVYLLVGIGSMGVVMVFASGPHGQNLTLGASGCIMGLIGATAALMLRGWLRAKAFAARRRLVAMVLIVGMQSVFDAVVPQVSMTAHLSGALLGFALTLMLRDTLKSTPPSPIAEASAMAATPRD